MAVDKIRQQFFARKKEDKLRWMEEESEKKLFL